MTRINMKNRFIAFVIVLMLVVAVMPMGAMAATTTSASYKGITVSFGDSYNPTPPESDMRFDDAGNPAGTYTVRYMGSLGEANFYPSILALNASGSSAITQLTGTNMTLTVTDTNPASPTYGQIMESGSTLTSYADYGFYTVSLSGAGTLTIYRGTDTLILKFAAPIAYVDPNATSTPTLLNGYLPIGQYSNGTGWGSPFSNGGATLGFTNGTPKVVGGYSSTGVSLGAAGGYVEYDYVVNNSSSTAYGVDFIVYGNAFVGNPEAGSVKVYGTNDGTNYAWYELAGSLYYDDITMRNVDVTYKKVTTAGGEFTSAGIWYKVTKGSSTLINWTKFNSNTAVTWWPEASEGYLGTNGVWSRLTTDPNVVIGSSETEITYKGVTLVRDTDTTADYAFGYADITPNGSSYGTPVNPYTYNTTGGNAYDISWAVDGNGNPVNLTSISKIRVYTSAALNVSDPTKFTVPAIFGETSAEVLGIYAVTTSGTGTSTAPTITVGGNSLATLVSDGAATVSTIGSVTFYDASDYYNTYFEDTATVVASVQNGVVFVNSHSSGTSGSNFVDFSSGATYVRIIAQDGTTSNPSITVIKLA